MYKFKVVVCCQGNPFEYKYRTMIGAVIGFVYRYLKMHKYGTMNFSLRQILITD